MADITEYQKNLEAATNALRAARDAVEESEEQILALNSQRNDLKKKCDAGESSACMAVANIELDLAAATRKQKKLVNDVWNAQGAVNEAQNQLQKAATGNVAKPAVETGNSNDEKMVEAAKSSPAVESSEVTTQPVSMPSLGAAAPAQKINEMINKVSSSGKAGELSGLVANATKSNILSIDKTLDSQSGVSEIERERATAIKALTENFRVQLVSRINKDDKVVFAITPTVTEDRQAQYSSSDLLHHPGQMQIYRSTSARTWSIQGMFVSRTAEEAQFNQDMVNLIRSWTMPYFGTGTEAEQKQQSGSRFGAPPDVLTLSGYGDLMIGPAPVVLTNAGFNWPNDVQYIQTAVSQTPFPVILQVSLSLVESYSAKEYSRFSLADYKKGILSRQFQD